MLFRSTWRGVFTLLVIAAALATGALVRPNIASAACTDSSHSGALIPAGHVNQSMTIHVYTTTDTPLSPMSYDIYRPNGTLYTSGPSNFGAKTPGGYYFALVTFTPNQTGTWKLKYSIQMDACSGLYTSPMINVSVS